VQNRSIGRPAQPGRLGRAARHEAARIAGLLVSAWLLVGCFDSDEVFKVADTATTGDPGTTSSSSTTTTTTSTVEESTGDEPMGDDRCIDAIDCVRGCILDLAQSNLPEPDLSCFLECTKTLSEQEALKLLRLGNCISDQCVVMDQCEGPGDDDTGGSSTGDGSSSSGDDGGGDGDGLLDPCLLCIVNGMLDPEPEGCVALAESCREPKKS
jgi:hypothetical protein